MWYTSPVGDMLTISQAALLLGISRDTMQRYARDGIVAAEQVNIRLYLVHKDEVERLRRERSLKPGRPRKPKDAPDD